MQQSDLHVFASQWTTYHISRTAHHFNTTTISRCLIWCWMLFRLSLWWCCIGWTKSSSVWGASAGVKRGRIDRMKMGNGALSVLLRWLTLVINIALTAVLSGINMVDHARNMSRNHSTMHGNMFWCCSGQKQWRWWMILVRIYTMHKVLWCCEAWNDLAVRLLQPTMVLCVVSKASVMNYSIPIIWDMLYNTWKGLLIVGQWLADLQLLLFD